MQNSHLTLIGKKLQPAKTFSARSAFTVLVSLFPIVIGGMARAQDASVFKVTLKPLTGVNQAVEAIQVSEVLRLAPSPDGSLKLTAPITVVGVTHIADRITELRVEDEVGPVTFDVKDDPENGYEYYRHWTSQRSVKFPVTISYKAAVQPDDPNGFGPPLGLRPSGGGAAGEGTGFLLLPEKAQTTSSQLHWDLSTLPAGSVGVMTAGETDATVPGPPDQLMERWYMVGPAGVYRAPNGLPFTGYWLGHPPFDPEAQMIWAARAYAYLTKSFAYLNPPPTYRVFIKAMSERPYGSGTANEGGFMLGIGEHYEKGEDGDYVNDVMFHEMTHQWVGQVEGGSPWFSEGLTVYFSMILPLRGGLISADLYGNRINERVHDYYVSPARNWSGAKIKEAGFSNQDARMTQYNRGALYFADLDASIRTHSHGKRNLITVLYPLFVARKNGAPLSQTTWEVMLRHELGEGAVRQFRNVVLEGSATLVPVSDAFGPCFERIPRKYKTSAGSEIDGYAWQRKANLPNTACTETPRS